MVYVINKDGSPLMPCKPAIARLLLKDDKAKCIRRTPFTIKLLYQATDYTQDLTLGIDTGSSKIGSAVVNDENEVYYISEVEIRNDISDNYQNQINKSQQRLSTGKKLSSDNPSSIGRGERLKSMINASRITQSALQDAQLKNQAMENTLSLLTENVSDLASLATEKGMPGADLDAIKSQAKQMLDSMAESMANTKFNGANPFTSGDTVITSNGGTSTFKTPKFNIAVNAEDPTTYDITLNDGTQLTGQSVDDILDSTFIETNLQTEVSNARSTVATNTNIMERHLKLETKNEEIMTQSLENLEGIDLSKETVEMNKNSALLQINNQLLSATTGQFAQQVGNILDIRL